MNDDDGFELERFFLAEKNVLVIAGFHEVKNKTFHVVMLPFQSVLGVRGIVKESDPLDYCIPYAQKELNAGHGALCLRGLFAIINMSRSPKRFEMSN